MSEETVAPAEAVKEKKDPTVTDQVKLELASKLAVVFGGRISQEKAWETLKVVMQTVCEQTKKHGRVGLPAGLGSFKLKTIAARERRIPSTGATFQAPESTKIRYHEGSKTGDEK